MFIRIKKISNKEYAYLVKNVWKKRKKASRQKVSSYLGRVYKLSKIKNEQLKDCSNLSAKAIIKELIKQELINHGFQETKVNNFEKDNFIVNLKKKEVKDKKTKKQICLEINNNFLCAYTLRKLLNFSPKQGLTKLQVGKELANAFESAGIIVPKELFVIIAQKILKSIEAN